MSDEDIEIKLTVPEGVRETEVNESDRKAVNKAVDPKYAGLLPPWDSVKNPPPKSPGAPKGPRLTTILRGLLEEIDPKTGRKEAEELVRATLKAAKRRSGSTDRRELWERMDGKVSQKIEAEVKINPIAEDIKRLREGI